MSYWSVNKHQPIDQYTIDLHKLSLYMIKRKYGECLLFTDSFSYPYFKNLGYTDIVLLLDNVPDINTHYNWALGKLFTYKYLSEKNINFCHVDYDVFLWEGLSEKFLQNSVFSQCVETNIYSRYALSTFELFAKNKHYITNISKDESAYNMGIFGGTNTKFIEKYSNAAIELSLDAHNIDCYRHMLRRTSFSVACLCEQYYLKICSKIFEQNISVLLNGTTETEIDNSAEENKYTHLSNIKRQPQIKEKIYNRLVQFNLI